MMKTYQTIFQKWGRGSFRALEWAKSFLHIDRKYKTKKNEKKYHLLKGVIKNRYILDSRKGFLLHAKFLTNLVFPFILRVTGTIRDFKNCCHDRFLGFVGVVSVWVVNASFLPSYII